MKKRTKIIIIIAIIFILFFISRLINAIQTMDSLWDDAEEITTQKLSLNNEIIFTGKVSPAQDQAIFLDDKKLFDRTYIEINQSVQKGEILFDYYGAQTTRERISIYENDFIFLKEEQDWLYTQIADLEQEISWNSAPLYLQSLKKELSTVKQDLSNNKIKWIDTETNITQLRQSLDDYIVKADFNGFVYEINDSPNLNQAYMILYSHDKIIKIDVGEYELQYIYIGQEVEIEIEGTQQFHTGEILSIDTFPNNMSPSSTSYFSVEISVDQKVPYGYSAIVRVSIK